MKIFKTILLTSILMFVFVGVFAQCSICSKTATQMGEDAGRGLNGGILYLAAAPFVILGYIGYRWWKNNSED